MAKAKTAYVCAECGASYNKWQGQCTECGAWNTLSEIVLEPASAAPKARMAGYAGAVHYDHSALLKSLERILEVPILAKVSGANDFSDLFEAGFFP